MLFRLHRHTDRIASTILTLYRTLTSAPPLLSGPLGSTFHQSSAKVMSMMCHLTDGWILAASAAGLQGVYKHRMHVISGVRSRYS